MTTSFYKATETRYGNLRENFNSGQSSLHTSKTVSFFHTASMQASLINYHIKYYSAFHDFRMSLGNGL